MSLKKILSCVRKNSTFLITSHINLEGDALGSELAFLELIKSMGKKGVILNQDKVPAEYQFLPQSAQIRNKIKDYKFDVGVVLDCSDLSRSGKVQDYFKKAGTLINVDHHVSNSRFADINWVDPHSSSVSEMIYRLYRKSGIPFNSNSAAAIYTGILTDTGSFRYTNTTSRTHLAVARLLRHDIKPQEIYRNIYQSNLLKDMKLLSKAFSLLKSDAQGKIAWFAIPGSLLKKSSFDFDLTEHILSFGRQIKGVEAVVAFKENPGNRNQIKVNLRSQGRVDMNKIAGYFGGGGHPSASACTVNGRLDAVAKRVLAKIKESL